MRISKLPKEPKDDKKKNTHHFHLEIPTELLDRMINEGGVVYGQGNAWVIDAIEKKLAYSTRTKVSQ